MNAAERRWRQKNKSHGPRGRAGARVGRGRRAGGLGQEPVVQREGPRRALHAVAVGDGAASARTAAEKREPRQKKKMKMEGDVTRNVVSAQDDVKKQNINKYKKESKKRVPCCAQKNLIRAFEKKDK